VPSFSDEIIQAIIPKMAGNMLRKAASRCRDACFRIDSQIKANCRVN
jgi:hypothetical protein